VNLKNNILTSIVSNDPYEGMTPANCIPDNCFCEALRYGEWIRQPANTWSNLAFLVFTIALIWILYKHKPNRNNKLIQNPSYTWLYAFGCFLTGAGSFYYHASFTFIAQWFDVMGMYFAVTFFAIYNLDRLYNWKSARFVLIYLIVNAALGFFLYAIPEARRYLFGTCFGILLVSAVYSQWKLKTAINSKYLLWAFISFAVGFAIWILDIKHIVCEPTSLFQLHSFWHVLTALSGFLIYLYYYSEDLSESH